ncbi:MAG TPA: hypothetical protein PLQ97_10420 [Myxococcota bacterium]|nr:hypothetical protein [Myxococcota bacterium]HQK51275.1 hypothetical protein [Myxococcota bacterium]
MTRRLPAILVAVVGVLAAVPARGGWGIVDLDVGAKAMGQGNLWTAPTDLPAYLGNQDWAFDNTRAGWAAGAGIYAQLRLWKALGLEVDFLIDQSRLQETPLDRQTWLLTARSVNLRIPLLLQGILPLPGVRLGVSLGPEFVIPLKTEALQSNPPLLYQDYDFQVDGTFATMLTMGLQVTPVILGHITIPIDLRASYNLTQPKDYEGRVTVHQRASGVRDLTQGFTLHLQNTWEFRLCLGVGYAF